MMGVNHATSGAAVWIAATTAMPYAATGMFPLEATGVLVGAAVCAGAALLPDADHHSATISQSVPVLGRMLTGFIGEVTGGHRQGAHSLLAVIVVAVAAYVLGQFTVATEWVGELAPGPAIATVALVAFAVKARELVPSWPLAWLVGLVAGVLVVFFAPESFDWFPLAIVLGYVTHLAGDFLTSAGLPGALWPWVPKPPRFWRRLPIVSAIWLPNGYFALPLLGDAGSAREKLLGTALAVYCTIGIGYEVLRGFGYDPAQLLAGF
ncbi:metal-dependent hydrolase [Agromyces archimandritae]|uniref:Metal-dependent hydrolase n=1 Tax=Agromyces archimandritae TaxID=2781962 RepID=A0A975INK9_9MICO|nr:metal-dependent hydrolase [Agromyces archimandritae]QTX04717.1 metal-dependent hydrolase [Agromyces archimandritae]